MSNMKEVFLLLIIILNISSYSQESSFTDLSDGINYKTIKINDNIWMSENLNTEKFRNGDIIKQIKSKRDFDYSEGHLQPAWCYYQYNDSTYGKLYNWQAVNDPRGLAPKGWHIPRPHEFDNIKSFNSNNLKAASVWKTEITYHEKGGYYDTDYIPCSNCNYWTKKQRDYSYCSKCENVRYFK